MEDDVVQKGMGVSLRMIKLALFYEANLLSMSVVRIADAHLAAPTGLVRRALRIGLRCSGQGRLGGVFGLWISLRPARSFVSLVGLCLLISSQR